MTRNLDPEDAMPSQDDSLQLAPALQPAKAKTPLLHKIAVIVSMLTVVVGSLTAIMTWANVGFGPGFLGTWLTSAAVAAGVMAPSGFVFMAAVSFVVGKLFPHLGDTPKNMLIGVSMAVIMESIMAASTAANTVGFTDMGRFANAWGSAFAVAIPVGLVLSTVMTLTLKPRLEKFMKS